MSFDLDEHFHPWEPENEIFSQHFEHWVRKAKRDGAIYLHAYGENARGGECWNVTLTDFCNPTHLTSVRMPPFAITAEEAMKIADAHYHTQLGIPKTAFERLLDFEL